MVHRPREERVLEMLLLAVMLELPLNRRNLMMMLLVMMMLLMMVVLVLMWMQSRHGDEGKVVLRPRPR